MKAFDGIKERLEIELERSLDFRVPELLEEAKKLHMALKYAVLTKAKRVRPILVILSAQTFMKNSSKAFKYALPAALAIEYVHCYSLAHDDLPSMDDDLYRRGIFSLHARFDEATAILVGDCLLSDAFFILANAPLNAGEQVKELSLAIGRKGLVLGQMGDLALRNFKEVNRLKTAKLFEASLALGALSVGAKKEEIALMRRIGMLWGEAFQIKDDLEDKRGSFLHLGTTGAKKAIFDIKQKIKNEVYFVDNKGILELFAYTLER